MTATSHALLADRLGADVTSRARALSSGHELSWEYCLAVNQSPECSNFDSGYAPCLFWDCRSGDQRGAARVAESTAVAS